MIDINQLRVAILNLYRAKVLPPFIVVARTNDPCYAAPGMVGSMIEMEGWKVSSLDLRDFANEGSKKCSKKVEKKLVAYLNSKFIKELKHDGVLTSNTPAGLLYTHCFHLTNLKGVIEEEAMTKDDFFKGFDYENDGALLIECCKARKLEHVKVKKISIDD